MPAASRVDEHPWKIICLTTNAAQDQHRQKTAESDTTESAAALQVRAYLKKGAKTYRSAWSTTTSVKTRAKAAKKSSGGTVYITNTGTKYHRDGCSSLRRSKHSTSKSEAQRQGYTACKVCKP